MPSTPSSAPPEPAAPRRSRAILAAVAVVVVLVVGGITWVAVASGNDDDSSATVVPKAVRNGGPTAGDVAPDFTLKTLDGKTVSLSDYRGKPVVLNFWASWCNPCRQEFSLFRKQRAAHPGEFVMLGVDNRDIESDARAFVKQQHATWPNLVDSGAVWKAYAATALPQTFFIRADGTIAERLYGEVSDSQFSSAFAKITTPASS